MNVQTKYNVGDVVYTIDKATLKMREFEISTVFVSTTDVGVEVKYHARGDSAYADNIPEEHCFLSENELLNHISSK